MRGRSTSKKIPLRRASTLLDEGLLVGAMFQRDRQLPLERDRWAPTFGDELRPLGFLLAVARHVRSDLGQAHDPMQARRRATVGPVHRDAHLRGETTPCWRALRLLWIS